MTGRQESGTAMTARKRETMPRDADQTRKRILEELAVRPAQWFDDEMEKLDNWAEDKRAGLKADLKDYDDQIKAMKKDIRLAGGLPEKLSLQRKVRDLESKRDVAWRAYDEAAKDIETQKDKLLDSVEDRLGQDVSDETLFVIEFEIV